MKSGVRQVRACEKSRERLTTAGANVWVPPGDVKRDARERDAGATTVVG